MKFRNIALSLVAVAALGLSGCGGGSSDDVAEETQTETSTAPQGEYTGAAYVGDFAEFSISGNTLSYELSGEVLGDLSGELTIENVYGPIWKDSNSDVYLFLTGNLGMAKVPTDSGSVYVVGLQQSETLSADKVAGKNYLYVSVRNNTGEIDGYMITFHEDGTYDAVSAAGDSDSGCWKILEGGAISHGVAKSGESDCSDVNDATADYRITFKPGTSRGGIVVDYADGSGFGIGVEQKALTDADVASGTFYSYYYQPNGDDEGFAKVTIENGTYSWAECNVATGTCTPLSSGTIALNQMCDGAELDGVACATDSDTGAKYNLFVDTEDGYYISVGTTTNTVEIGSNK